MLTGFYSLLCLARRAFFFLRIAARSKKKQKNNTFQTHTLKTLQKIGQNNVQGFLAGGEIKFPQLSLKTNVL